MPCDYSKYPANWKTEIRPAILKRENNRCKFCGLRNYSVGNRENGEFIPTAGNIIHDAAGRGELPYNEALELVKHCNSWADDKLIMIVLTIAHLDHDTTNNDYSNLAALCQRCHNRYDVGFRKANRKARKGQMELL